MPVSVISFAEAIRRTDGVARDILLGNGFSIAAHQPFAYGGLLEKADLAAEVRAIFAAARTTNFEAVMRYWLAEAFGASPADASRAEANVGLLKRALVEAVHRVHPPRRNAIGPEQWKRCEQFLVNFIGRERDRRKLGGRIFTTNYDLLLWWAVAPDRGRIKPDKLFKGHDGFRLGRYEGLGAADMIYLHGALHLYPEKRGLTKLSYSETGVALHDQVAARLINGSYPLFVSEGASSLKAPVGDGYLSDALRAFRGTCQTPGKALFTLGHGLGPEDGHILDWIKKGKIARAYLGAHGSGEIEAFKPIAASWVEARASAGKPQLEIGIYDTTDVVWG